METYQITLKLYYIHTSECEACQHLLTPTPEQFDAFMVKNVQMDNPNSSKQYESLINGIYNYTLHEVLHTPYKMEYIPGGFITFRVDNPPTYLEDGVDSGKHLSRDEIIEEIQQVNLESTWEEGVGLYKFNGKQIGLFDFFNERELIQIEMIV